MFFDETSKESIPVCGKADCSHDCADCNAYFGSAKHYDRNAPEKVYIEADWTERKRRVLCLSVRI